MTPARRLGRALPVALLLQFGAVPARSQEVDNDAALSLAKKGNCLKCHSIERRKNAPSYKEIAAKFKGKSDAEQTLYRHLTANPLVKTEDGDEVHASLPTKDEAEVRNVIRWVLSR